MARNTFSVLPEFNYIKPDSFMDASQFLIKHQGEARPFLGGTDTFVRMRDGLWKEKHLVDLKGLPGMNEISFDYKKGLTIGAAVNMNMVSASDEVQEYYPLLAEAVDKVASYQLRTRATIIGNICNASPAGDTIGACLLFNGILKVHGVDGIRYEPLDSFFKGPGKTILGIGDIVLSLTLPIPPNKMVGKYIKLGRNNAGDLSIVGVSATAYPDQTTSSGYRFRLALASVAPVPLMVDEVEVILATKSINADLIAAAAQASMDACQPISDVRASARYRKMMVRNLSQEALSIVWEEVQQ